MRLVEFMNKHADAREAIRAWAAEVEDSDWRTPVDVKRRYPHASVITGRRIVFNIKGRRYRLDALIDFTNQILIVRRAGTHAEYNSWSFE